MTTDQIEQFLEKKQLEKQLVRISFKNRAALTGIFIRSYDYNELKSKNLWRVVWESNVASYKKTEDINLARIFNGIEITKLSAATAG